MTAHSVRSTWKSTLFLAGYTSIALFMLGSQWAVAQQTLGSMNGTVTDSKGRRLIPHRRPSNWYLRGYVHERWFQNRRLSTDPRARQSYGDAECQAQSGSGVVDDHGGSHAATE